MVAGLVLWPAAANYIRNHPEMGSRAQKVAFNIIDMLTGESATEWARDENPDRFNKAEKLGLTLAEYEKFRDALQSDLSKLERELSQLEDPSLFMENNVRNSLDHLGFVNSKFIVDILNKRFNVRSFARKREIDNAHSGYLKKQSEYRRKIADKENAISNQDTKIRQIQNEIDRENNKTNAQKALDPE
jgi:prefoldin subunit 5